MLTIAESSILALPGQTGRDTSLQLPVRMDVPGGAKITVAGGAEVTLPEGAAVSAPSRPPFTLSPQRSHFRLPQGSNVLTGTLGMVIVTALVTIFGIGAELGIAAVLAVGLSDASSAGRWFLGAGAVGLGIFALCYSVTALRTIADPQPGSSMSSTDGTSFTL